MFVLITLHSCSIPNSAFDLFSGSFQTINHAKLNARQIRVDCVALPQLLMEAQGPLARQLMYNYVQL